MTDAIPSGVVRVAEGVGLEIVGPRTSEATMRMLDFARSNRLPYTWQDEVPAGVAACLTVWRSWAGGSPSGRGAASRGDRLDHRPVRL